MKEDRIDLNTWNRGLKIIDPKNSRVEHDRKKREENWLENVILLEHHRSFFLNHRRFVASKRWRLPKLDEKGLTQSNSMPKSS